MLTPEQIEEIGDIIDTLYDGYPIEQSAAKLLRKLLDEHKIVKESFLQQFELAHYLLYKELPKAIDSTEQPSKAGAEQGLGGYTNE